MNGVATASRLTTILAATATFMCAAGIAAARDTTHGLSVATITNGVVTYKIPTGPQGLELSSNGPGTITVTSGSNSVTVRGPAITLSGGVVLAPYSTPGVQVTPNNDGGYTVVLDTLLRVLPDPDLPDSTEATRRLANDLARELADADFGDRAVTAGLCIAPSSEKSASP
jgi:uncharacterized Zn-binding protein involved in type VI secretion